MSTAEKLLDAAETRMRDGGFHAVSFRDLADDLNIKSASVHYYYRHKEDLGVAVVARYAARFLERLEAAAGPDADAATRLAAICAAFREALVQADQICLCGVMGAEALGLPDAVRAEVAKFLRAGTDWLAAGFETLGTSPAQAKGQAMMVLAALEGAMILAVNLQDQGAFDAVVAQLQKLA